MNQSIDGFYTPRLLPMGAEYLPLLCMTANALVKVRVLTVDHCS